MWGWGSSMCTWMGSSSSHCPDTSRSPYSPMHQDATCTRGCYRTQTLIWNTNHISHNQIYHCMLQKMDMSKIESWPNPELLWPVRCHPAVLCRVSVLCRHASPHCWWWAGWDWEQSHLAHNSLPVRMRRDNNAIRNTCLQVCSENKAPLVEEVFCQIWWEEYSRYNLIYPL